MKTVQILGATGSIGLNTISIIKEHPDKFKVKNLVANNNYEKLAELAKEVNAEQVVISNPKLYANLKSTLSGSKIKVHAGEKAVEELAAESYNVTISGIVGIAALKPTLAAMKNSKIIGLANKESIICAGDLMLNAAKQNASLIVPVDSEHSAIFQIFNLKEREKIRNIIITASRGPFRNKSLAEMKKVTPEQAATHPNWKMGGKISVDCATLINKGLEVIEATKLFALSSAKISVLVHPESIVHGLVNYEDGTTLAHLSVPSMRTPISYSLYYPERLKIKHKELNLAELSKLHFDKPDYKRFPLLKLAIDIAKKSQSEMIALNVANEVAVDSFLNRKIAFLQINEVVSDVIAHFKAKKINSLDDVFAVVDKVKAKAQSLIKKIKN